MIGTAHIVRFSNGICTAFVLPPGTSDETKARLSNAFAQRGLGAKIVEYQQAPANDCRALSCIFKAWQQYWIVVRACVRKTNLGDLVVGCWRKPDEEGQLVRQIMALITQMAEVVHGATGLEIQLEGQVVRKGEKVKRGKAHRGSVRPQRQREKHVC